MNFFKHPTSILRKLINTILQPLVKQSFSCIKDSQVFLKTKNLTMPDNILFYTLVILNRSTPTSILIN